MFLKKIRINGFKSFAKPVEINFHSPLTAIVGPNGSGKSNIVDAIRWTLGEQSAKSLRGSRMSDVIFAGSEDHKPLNKASVTLFFDNSQGDLPLDSRKIQIKRSVTDDGQSDYYLNGSLCRLKDIDELLMDTGLGKDSYSIVGQGKIDSILNSKPEKLRELFEEAAGIVKHKSRKMDAERRLEKTKHDLQRIKDLVWELDKQVKPLKRAANKAKKYQRLHEELKVLEVNLLLDRREQNLQILKTVYEEETVLKRSLTKLEKRLEDTNILLEERKEKLEYQEEVIEKLQESFYDTKIKKEQAENSLNVLAERKKGLLKEETTLNNQLDSISSDRKELLEKKESIDKDIQTVNTEELDLKDKLSDIEKKLINLREKIRKKEEELYNSRNSIINENTELNDLQSNIEKVREKNRYLEKTIDKLMDKRKQLSGQLDINIIEQEELVKKQADVEHKIKEARDKLSNYQEQEKNIEKSLNDIQNEIKNIRKDLNQATSRVKVLRDMEDDYQGYFRGVKTIMQKSENITGINGVISDLIKVEKKYEQAIETALGAKLQNIVTEDDKVAQQAIEYLKKNKGGRATFLPLNMIKGKMADLSDYHITNVEGFLGLGTDFIKNEKKLNKVISYLLGRTIIAKDLKSATYIAKKMDSNLKIVTLDGDIINPGGAITGGSQIQNSGGLLGRTREIDELTHEIKNLEDVLKQKEIKEKDNRKKLNKYHTLRENTNKDINEFKFKINDLNKDLSTLKKEELKLENEINSLDKEFEDYHQQLGHNDNRKQTLERKISIINSENSREKDKIIAREDEVKKLQNKEEKINEQLTEIKIKMATIKQKKNSLVSEKDKIVYNIKELKEKKKYNQGQLVELKNKLENLENRKKELEEMKNNFSTEIKKIDKKQKQYKEDFAGNEKEVDRLQEQYNNFQHKLANEKDKYHKIDLKKTRLEDKNEQICEKLIEEYEVDVNKGIEERINISNYNETLSKIKEFKEGIKKLEPVNLGAIKEYQELQERLEYLSDQQKDLISARKSIEKLIDELNNNMSKMFYQTFTEVKDHFEDIFKKLFNGGMAEIILNKPEDLLETGVEIEAQPPGKQLKKLSLMSGGERALTAIALVFAFMKVNPSPIYILDEIDAPLDDANVLRFANYLNEYSSYVQFMLITHNKKMMTQANIIYGITMEDPGVSKLISLKMDKEEIA